MARELPDGGRRFSDEEVALIIRRATELQTTGAAESDVAAGMTLTEVEQVAKEAGIEPSLVRRAASEVARRSPSQPPRPSPFLGAPSIVIVETVVRGELPDEEYESVVNEMRRSFNDAGIATTLGRTLSWVSSSPRSGKSQTRQVTLAVMPRDGETTIRIEESLNAVAHGVFGGIIGGGTGLTVLSAVGFGLATLHSPLLAVAIFAGGAGGIYATARGVFGGVARRRERELRTVLDRIANYAELANRSAGRSSGGR